MKLTSIRMMVLLASMFTLTSFGEEEAGPLIEATCNLNSQMREGVKICGVSVYYSEAVLGNSPNQIAHTPRFQKTRWFGTDKGECTFTLESCKRLRNEYACTLGPEKRHYGRAGISTTSRPWVLVGPQGTIESYENGPFAWNASGLEHCMEDLVSRIFERL